MRDASQMPRTTVIERYSSGQEKADHPEIRVATAANTVRVTMTVGLNSAVLDLPTVFVSKNKKRKVRQAPNTATADDQPIIHSSWQAVLLQAPAKIK